MTENLGYPKTGTRTLFCHNLCGSFNMSRILMLYQIEMRAQCVYIEEIRMLMKGK